MRGDGEIDGVEIRGNTIDQADSWCPPAYMNDHPDVPATMANVVVADNTIGL